jgi:hypothetical protein
MLSNLFAFDERATGLEVSAALDANTLSGPFMRRLGRMPAAGDAIAEPGFRLEVVAMADHHVGRVSIVPLARSTPDSGSVTPNGEGSGERLDSDARGDSRTTPDRAAQSSTAVASISRRNPGSARALMITSVFGGMGSVK